MQKVFELQGSMRNIVTDPNELVFPQYSYLRFAYN